MKRRSAILALASAGAALVMPTMAFAGPIYSPKRGDPLRKQLLDTIRARVEAEMRQRVQFVVSVINVQDNWAYLAVDPVDLRGKPIDIKTTKYANEEFMDGLTTFSLLRYKNGRWNEISFFTGPTDVSQLAWIEEFGISKKLMGF